MQKAVHSITRKNREVETRNGLSDTCWLTAAAMGIIRKAIKPQFVRGKWKILRGDLVQITAGKDKGQQGVISKVIRDDRVPRVIVEGRNLVSCLRLAPVVGGNFVPGAHLQCWLIQFKLHMLFSPVAHEFSSHGLQVKRHIKRTEGNPGGIITTESPLHYSNVQVVDPVTKAPVRLTWRFLEDGTKVSVPWGAETEPLMAPIRF